MQPGKRYRGYGMVNDYKEFIFTPEATGSQHGREKVLQTWQQNMMTLKETKNYLIVTMKETKGKQEAELIRSLMMKFNELYNFVKSHEI